MQVEEIKALIENNLPLSTAYVTGDGAHFNAIVICEHFIQQSALDRQRAVYTSVHPHIQNGNIHALSIKTYTPQEYESITKK